MAEQDGTDQPSDGRAFDRRAFVGKAAGVAGAAAAASMFGTAGKAVAASQTQQLTGKIVIWDFLYGNPAANPFESVVDKILTDANPSLQIEHVAVPHAQYNQVIAAAANAHQGPDVFLMDPAGAGAYQPQYVASLTPLSKYVTPTLRTQLVDWNAYTVRGKGLLGMPFFRQGLCFYYNKTLFSHAGLDPNKPPTTYAQLLKTCDRLKSQGITPFSDGNKEGYAADWWIWSLLAGLAPLSVALQICTGTRKMTDPVMVKASQLFLDLVHRGYFSPGFASQSHPAGSAPVFLAGKAAMAGGLDSGYPVGWFGLKALGNALGSIPGFAVNRAKPYYYPIGPGGAYGLTTYAKNVPAAVAWIRTASGATVGQTLANTGYFPANKATKSPTDLPALPPLQKAYSEVPTAYPLAYLPGAMIIPFGQAINEVVTGGTSLKQALNNVEALRPHKS